MSSNYQNNNSQVAIVKASNFRSSSSRSRSYSKDKNKHRNSQNDKRKNKLACCSECSQNDKAGNKKTCICVVPADQRRNKIEGNGCRTCGCNGCSQQDFDNKRKNNHSRGSRKSRSRSRDRNRHQNSHNHSRNNKNQEQIQNGCCKQCMKAFSATGKACICQVPSKVRKNQIPPTGCNYCQCHGCNPEDLKDQKQPYNNNYGSNYNNNRNNNNNNNNNQNYNQQQYGNNNNNQQKFNKNNNNNEDSDEEGYKNYFNIINSSIGRLVTQGMNINPLYQTGFGIPQRTQGYLQGRQDK